MMMMMIFLHDSFSYCLLTESNMNAMQLHFSLNQLVVFLLSTPMGIDYVVIGFNMEVQPLVTHNAA